jgi:hypothetical protein
MVDIATGNVPDMETLHSQFHGARHLLPGPYFIGYCGESQAQYPGVVQLAGASHAVQLEGIHSYFAFLFFAQRFQGICFKPLIRYLAIVRVLMKKAAAFVPTFISHLPLPGHSQGSEDERMLD